MRLLHPPSSRRPRGLFVILSAALLCCLTAAIAVRQSFFPRHPALLTDLDAAARSMGSERRVCARLSGLSHQPPPPGAGQPETGARAPSADIVIRLRQAARSRDPAEIAAAAQFSLLTGDTDTAVALLKEAILTSGRSADLWSDLAAAYLTVADRQGDPRVQVTAQAIDAAGMATALAPLRPSGWFNLALGFEKVGMEAEALAAWEQFESAEKNADWRNEGRRRADSVRALRRQSWDSIHQRLLSAVNAFSNDDARGAADSFRQPLRECLEDELLPAWGRSRLSRDEALAGIQLRTIVQLASALAESTGDALLRDAVSILQTTAPATVDALARGHVAYGDARREYEANQFETAGTGFATARAELSRAQSPFRALAEHELAVVKYQRRSLGDARSSLDAVIASSTRRGYTSLAARAELVRGIVRMQQEDIEGALTDYASASEHFEHIGEVENLGNVANTAADTLRLIGQHASGWVYLGKALSTLPHLRSVRRRYVVLLNASLYAADSGLDTAALLFQNASLKAAQERAVANTLVEAYTRRAALYLRVDDLGRAAADLEAADAHIGHIQSDASRTYQQAWLSGVRGEYLRRVRPAQALPALDAGIAYFMTGEPAEIPRLYLARARASLALGDNTEAEQSLTAGVQHFDSRWRTLGSKTHRISYLDDGWALFEELIDLYAVRRGMPDAAFKVAEGSRGRTLLRQPQDARGVPGPDAVRAALPTGTALVYYVTLPQRLLTWTITADAVRFATRELRASALAAQIDAYRRLIEARRPSDELKSLATTLYDELLRPLVRGLPAGTNVVIVPDGPLNALPFATLVDSGTDEFAIQQFALGVSPNAREFLRSTQRLSERATTISEALAVGNSAPSSSLKLPALPDVAAELASVAALYPHAIVLQDAAATVDAFRRQAPTANVIHFAGHARADLRYPELSTLVLASSASTNDGMLLARDIEQWELPTTSLVVLGACETAYGNVYRGEGLISLARPFLTAGAASVVGSHWEIDDAVSRQLLTAFHREFIVTRDPLLALRRAQLQLIASRKDARLREPAAWGSFVAVSGVRRTAPTDSRH